MKLGLGYFHSPDSLETAEAGERIVHGPLERTRPPWRSWLSSWFEQEKTCALFPALPLTHWVASSESLPPPVFPAEKCRGSGRPQMYLAACSPAQGTAPAQGRTWPGSSGCTTCPKHAVPPPPPVCRSPGLALPQAPSYRPSDQGRAALTFPPLHHMPPSRDLGQTQQWCPQDCRCCRKERAVLEINLKCSRLL